MIIGRGFRVVSSGPHLLVLVLGRVWHGGGMGTEWEPTGLARAGVLRLSDYTARTISGTMPPPLLCGRIGLEYAFARPRSRAYGLAVMGRRGWRVATVGDFRRVRGGDGVGVEVPAGRVWVGGLVLMVRRKRPRR